MAKREHYSDDTAMLGSGGDVGRFVPLSDAEDFVLGATYIPSQVTTARRAGESVAFVTNCQTSVCCWYWHMQDGTHIHYFEHKASQLLRDEHNGMCPDCGNTHIKGETVDPEA